MSLPPITISPIILFVIVLEIAILFNQVLSYLSRPHEKKRLWHLLLIGMLVLYNLTENLIRMPDPHIPLSTIWQGVISESTGYFVTAYIPFYAFKTMDFRENRFRFHARFGFLFVLVPAVFFFFFYYPITGNLLLTRRYVYILPATYAVTALFATGRNIYIEFREDGNKHVLKERLYIFTAIFFWCTCPLVGAFGGAPKWVVGVFSNLNFLLLNFLYMRRLVRISKTEYRELQQSNTTLTERVKERTAQLEQAIEERTNTLINLVHETKTPITLINNYLAEYIARKGSDDDLRLVKTNVDKLHRDIHNIFNLERYQKGLTLYDHAQITDLSEMLEGNLRLFGVYCERRGQALKSQVRLAVLVKADPQALNAVINNLIENAVKYTAAGGKIEVGLQQEEKIIFTISDTGTGIPQPLQEKVFETYFQIADEKKASQGLGLGLPLVKKILDDIGAEICIDSTPGQGTTITVLFEPAGQAGDLPLTEAWTDLISGLEMTTDIEEKDYDSSKQTVLVIEDNRAMAAYLWKKLAGRYNTLVAGNGQQALSRLKEITTIDLIISDVMMDKLDGFGLAKILSEHKDYHHIPIIFLSAKQDQVKGLRLGAIDYVSKPFNPEELLAKIDAFLENALKQKRVYIQQTLEGLSKSTGIPIHMADGISRPQTDKLSENARLYNLTEREVEIVRVLQKGATYKEIGDTLFIAESTVKKHVQNIFFKLQVGNKVQLLNKLEQ